MPTNCVADDDDDDDDAIILAGEEMKNLTIQYNTIQYNKGLPRRLSRSYLNQPLDS